MRSRKPFDDLRHVAMQQRFAAGDGDRRRAAFVDRVHAFVEGQALVEDLVGIVDLAAAGAGEVAAEQRLQHQHQRIALAAGQMLLDDIGADRAACLNGMPTMLLRSYSFSNSAGRRNSICSFLPSICDDFDTASIPRSAVDHIFDQLFRRRGAGGEADRLLAAHPCRIEFAAVGDQIARHAFLEADLAQPVGVRAVLGADDQDDVRDLGTGRAPPIWRFWVA